MNRSVTIGANIPYTCIYRCEQWISIVACVPTIQAIPSDNSRDETCHQFYFNNNLFLRWNQLISQSSRNLYEFVFCPLFAMSLLWFFVHFFLLFFFSFIIETTLILYIYIYIWSTWCLIAARRCVYARKMVYGVFVMRNQYTLDDLKIIVRVSMQI